MNEERLSPSGLLTQAVSGLKAIRTRTWLILGGVVMLIIGLIVWAGIALLSWLWAQTPAATEMGKRAVTEGATRIEQAAPELKAQAERWLPGIEEQIGRWVPGFGDEPPARDVSGADPGPVPRLAGLVRSHYGAEGGTVEVHYAGRADFDATLAHYVKGFAGAGYVQEVISATPEVEQHRFLREGESYDLTLTSRSGGVIEVRLRQSLRP